MIFSNLKLFAKADDGKMFEVGDPVDFTCTWIEPDTPPDDAVNEIKNLDPVEFTVSVPTMSLDTFRRLFIPNAPKRWRTVAKAELRYKTCHDVRWKRWYK